MTSSVVAMPSKPQDVTPLINKEHNTHNSRTPHDGETIDLVDDSMSLIPWKGLAIREVDLAFHQSGGGASQMESRSINGLVFTNDTHNRVGDDDTHNSRYATKTTNTLK